jgi:hypothetical protein
MARRNSEVNLAVARYNTLNKNRINVIYLTTKIPSLRRHQTIFLLYSMISFIKKIDQTQVK